MENKFKKSCFNILKQTTSIRINNYLFVIGMALLLQLGLFIGVFNVLISFIVMNKMISLAPNMGAIEGREGFQMFNSMDMQFQGSFNFNVDINASSIIGFSTIIFITVLFGVLYYLYNNRKEFLVLFSCNVALILSIIISLFIIYNQFISFDLQIGYESYLSLLNNISSYLNISTVIFMIYSLVVFIAMLYLAYSEYQKYVLGKLEFSIKQDDAFNQHIESNCRQFDGKNISDKIYDKIVTFSIIKKCKIKLYNNRINIIKITSLIIVVISLLFGIKYYKDNKIYVMNTDIVVNDEVTINVLSASYTDYDRYMNDIDPDKKSMMITIMVTNDSQGSIRVSKDLILVDGENSYKPSSDVFLHNDIVENSIWSHDILPNSKREITYIFEVDDMFIENEFTLFYYQNQLTNIENTSDNDIIEKKIVIKGEPLQIEQKNIELMIGEHIINQQIADDNGEIYFSKFDVIGKKYVLGDDVYTADEGRVFVDVGYHKLPYEMMIYNQDNEELLLVKDHEIEKELDFLMYQIDETVLDDKQIYLKWQTRLNNYKYILR